MDLSLLSQSAPAPRQYQSSIAEAVLKNGSTLVVLPTGLGKTLIALLVLAQKLKEGRALFLAPTRPLAAQHEKVCRQWLNLAENEIALVVGKIPPQKRKALYLPPSRLIISTPQTIANDLKAQRMSFDFNTVVFDECHRAVGKYAYTYIAQEAQKSKSLVLGLTASPGGDKKRISSILSVLGISHVQIRTAEDEDVKPYVKPIEIQWIKVELTPQLNEAKAALSELILKQAEILRKMGFSGNYLSKKGLSEMRAKILSSTSNLRFPALSHHSTLFSLVHIQELLETQGVEAVHRFVQRIKERKPSKAQSRILHDPKFAAMIEKLQNASEHPKLKKLVELAKTLPAGEKSIVFCQYRDQVNVVVRELCKAGLSARPFMGKKEGVTEKDQAATLAAFREGAFSILVATSIGEEGLDIPSVDNVIFYEPVASEIRHIQRRGRAGRAKFGKMFGLMTANTRDQSFFWSSKKKEEKMKKIIRQLSLSSPSSISSLIGAKGSIDAQKGKEQAAKPPKGQNKLTDF